MRQWRVRIYRSQVTPPAALTAPPVLLDWSAWGDLRGAGRDRRIPTGPGLYRIRRAGGEPGLDYVGQTGRSLRGRLGQLGGVYRAQMPYRDPHTAGPALWALRHRDGCDFEVAVIEVPGTAAQRKALEAAAITLYRIGSGRSPGACFGRMPAGYRISSGNNARLAAAGRRFRGGPTRRSRLVLPVCRSAGCRAPIRLRRTGWAGHGARGRRSPGPAGQRRAPGCTGSAPAALPGWSTSAREPSRSGSGRTRQKPLVAGHRQGPGFSGDLEASWVALPGLPLVSLLEHENDLIAAHVLATGHAPAAQFLG